MDLWWRSATNGHSWLNRPTVVFFNGYVAFRLGDVKRINRDKSFETAFAKTQPEWPPVYPYEVGLESTSDVLEGLGHGGAYRGR